MFEIHTVQDIAMRMLSAYHNFCTLEHGAHVQKCILCAWVAGNLANVVACGHLGDGNLHLNISAPQYDDKVTCSSKWQ